MDLQGSLDLGLGLFEEEKWFLTGSETNMSDVSNRLKIVPRVRPTPTRFQANILYAPYRMQGCPVRRGTQGDGREPV